MIIELTHNHILFKKKYFNITIFVYFTHCKSVEF